MSSMKIFDTPSFKDIKKNVKSILIQMLYNGLSFDIAPMQMLFPKDSEY